MGTVPPGALERARLRREQGSKETPRERVRVYCSQWASCGWTGMRISDRIGVQPEPCPKCGKDVLR